MTEIPTGRFDSGFGRLCRTKAILKVLLTGLLARQTP